MVIHEHYVVRGWTLPQVMEYLETHGYWRSPGQERSPWWVDFYFTWSYLLSKCCCDPLNPNLTKTYEKTDNTKFFSVRSYRKKLAEWQYLRREDEGKGNMKGKERGAAANSQTGSSKTQISHPPATNSVPLQVGGSDQAAQSGFNFDAGQNMGQFDQSRGGDGQFGQFQHNTQDCQDPDCQGERYPNHNFH